MLAFMLYRVGNWIKKKTTKIEIRQLHILEAQLPYFFTWFNSDKLHNQIVYRWHYQTELIFEEDPSDSRVEVRLSRRIISHKTPQKLKKSVRTSGSENCTWPTLHQWRLCTKRLFHLISRCAALRWPLCRTARTTVVVKKAYGYITFWRWIRGSWVALGCSKKKKKSFL